MFVLLYIHQILKNTMYNKSQQLVDDLPSKRPLSQTEEGYGSKSNIHVHVQSCNSSKHESLLLCFKQMTDNDSTGTAALVMAAPVS